MVSDSDGGGVGKLVVEAGRNSEVATFLPKRASKEGHDRYVSIPIIRAVPKPFLG